MASGRLCGVGLTLLLVTLVQSCLCGQPDRPKGTKRPVSSDDSAAGVVEDTNGNLYLVGASGDHRCVVVKCDARGEVLWHRQLEEKQARCESIVVAHGGGVVVAGYNRSKGREGLVVARFDASGELKWSKKLPQPVGFLTKALVLARPEHYLVAASNTSAHIFRAITPQGEVAWEKRFKGRGFYIWDLLLSGDNELTATGRYHPTSPGKGQGLGKEDLAIASFDLEGGGWTKRVLGSQEAEFGRAIIATSDHLVTAGRRATKPGGQDAPSRSKLYLTKTTRTGEIAWEKLIGRYREVSGVDLAQGKGDQLLVIANAVKKAPYKQAKAGSQRILNAALSTKVAQLIVVGGDGAVIRTEELDIGTSTSLLAITRLKSGAYCAVGKVQPEEQLFRNRVIPHHRMLVLQTDDQGKVAWKRTISSERLEQAQKPGKPKQGAPR